MKLSLLTSAATRHEHFQHALIGTPNSGSALHSSVSLRAIRGMVLARSLTPGGSTSSLRAMSRLPFELLLALRYLRPKRTFVSVITLISIIGVMLGVAVLIIVISVMSGFDHHLRDVILGSTAHLTVLKHDKNMKDYRAVMKIVAS